MSTTLNLLKKHHIRPLKKYGQSFLTDDQIFHKIVAAGHLQREDTVVEIGAGLGVMTGMHCRERSESHRRGSRSASDRHSTRKPP